MRSLLLTRYGRLGASSRLRALQFLPYLERSGFSCDVSPLFSDEYVSALYAGGARGWHVARGYTGRMMQLLRSRKYDVIWVEKECFPYLPAWLDGVVGWGGAPLVVDYDDAIFHNYDLSTSRLIRLFMGGKIDAVMRNATVVTVGNGYLGARASSAGARQVELLPTVVDRDRYAPIHNDSAVVTVGWIGSPATSRYLGEVWNALAAVQRRHGIRVNLIGAGPVAPRGVEIEVTPWSEANEAALLASIDIGIMPLPNTPWEQGKCGYKLVQYMACGKPVIASPVGVNNEIVRQGVNGFLAADESEWEQALEALVTSAQLRREMGAAGRSIMESEYSLQVVAPKLVRIFEQAAGGKR